MSSRYDAEHSTDATHAQVAFVVDMRPTSLLEANVMGGSRVNMPVGQTAAELGTELQSGGRGYSDTIAGQNLGVKGRKN